MYTNGSTHGLCFPTVRFIFGFHQEILILKFKQSHTCTNKGETEKLVTTVELYGGHALIVGVLSEILFIRRSIPVVLALEPMM